jgi:hypothetical protein
MQVELWFLHTALLLVILHPHMKFQVNMWNSLGVMARTKNVDGRWKTQNHKRGITQKIMHVELWFLYTALPYVILHPHMKFQENTLNSLGVMARTKWKTQNYKKGNNSKNDACRVMVLTHCTPLYHTASTYEVSRKYLIQFRCYGPDKMKNTKL